MRGARRTWDKNLVGIFCPSKLILVALLPLVEPFLRGNSRVFSVI